jgi:AraC family transcriptional regulator of adaptative response / DNA-3-methyladenine glycosylase II
LGAWWSIIGGVNDSSDDFSAVVTTGIYCRPGCGARPHPRNVRRFSTAAGAEAAGFRACLLAHRPPLEWSAMLDYFRARAIAGVEHVSADAYRRTIDVDGDVGVIELSSAADDRLLLRAHLPHWEGLIHHVQRARRIFNLDYDLDGAVGRLRDDPILGPLLDARRGLRPPGTWDPFETGVRAIVGQQVSVPAANTIVARLVARWGTPVAGLSALGLTHVFPSAETLSAADLDGLGLTRARARTINEFARAVVAGEIALDRSATLDQLVASIVATPGLGAWSAHYLALRLGEPDAFPAGDLGLRRALADATGAAVAERAAAEQAERWRPHRAHAAIHLWLGYAPL